MKLRFKYTTVLLLFLFAMPLCSAYSLFGYDFGVLNGIPPDPPFLKSNVTRSFSDNTPNQCSELTVYLDVNVNEGETYYAIDEMPPAGWVISNPGTGATNESGHIKWIVIQGVVDTVYQYKVMVPCDALGNYSFDGIYMFESDTEEQTILGETDVDVQEVECIIDDDCNDLDNDDYCDEDLIKHDEGRCVDYECTTETTLIEDCNDQNNDYCYGTEIKHDDYTCSAAACVVDLTTLVEDCDNQLYCDGEETCVDAACVAGTPIDCTANDIGGIATCDNDPDNDTLTWDYRAAFTSVCVEPGTCTTGDETITHACDMTRCGAQCEQDSDCDDGLGYTLDTCNQNCYCEHVTQGERICQYASSASATSENIGSEAIYATGAPDADGECEVWSGQYKSWNPEDWSIVGIITLYYDTPVYVTNFTILGDYEMCWTRMWLKNTDTGEQLEVFNDLTKECNYVQLFDENFRADTIILETCGTCWSSTDAVEMCGLNICHDNDDCDYLDDSYCDADFIMKIEGVCNQNSECEAGTPTLFEDCNDLNNNYCEGTEIKHDDYTCESVACVLDSTTVVEDCDDGLVCNGDETCVDAACVAGTPVDCSANDISGIATCDNDPDDANPFTWDYRAAFTSQCTEPTGTCTTGDETITHKYSEECNYYYCSIHGPRIIVDDEIYVYEGDLLTLDIEITDPDEDPLTYTISAPVGNDKKWQTQKGDKGTYYVTITVSDGFCIAEKIVKIIVREKSHQGLIFTRTNYKEFLKPGEMQELYVTVENTGNTNFEDLKITAFIDTLGIWKKTRKFELKKGETTKLIDFIIPYYAPKGRHYIRIVVSNDNIRRVIYRDFDVI